MENLVMKRMLSNIFLIATALMPVGFASMALGQIDPPERVARLNFIEGAVSYLPSGGGDNDWVAAVLNRPITTGDRLWADANSRTELHVGSSAIRMSNNTAISLLNLDDANVQIRLSDGLINIRLRRLDRGDSFEVDTPNVAFSVRRPGTYSIDTHPETNETIITVRQGEGEVIGGGRSWHLISDQQVIFGGTDSLAYDLRPAGLQPPDDFERWARSRDEREDRAAAGRYVSPEMTGYEDLDAYGRWSRIPEYGWCWTPTGVEAGWAPYRHGHWVWIAPWGWTWVEDEPWGFAPFHYGRWAHYRGSWMWVPGPVVARPVYAPALVAWVGGSGFSISVSLGSRGGVGWFPLGPREVFVPSYHVSERYVTNVNVTNIVVNRTTVINVYNKRQNVTYVNRAAPNAVTVVPQETFVNARPVARNIVSVQPREMESVSVSRAPAAAPERSSVYGAGNRNAPRPPAQSANRPVVVKHAPAPEPNHFERPQIATPDRPRTETPGRQINQPPNRTRIDAPARQQEQNAPPMRPNVSAEKLKPAPQVLARPAPPVRRPTSAEQADVKAKQRAWEDARSRGKQDQKQDQNQKPARPPRKR